MDLNSLTLRLVLLAVPGLLASRIYRKLIGRVERKPWEDFAEVLIFSILSYMIYSISHGFWNWWFALTPENIPATSIDAPQNGSVLQTALNENAPLDWAGISFATPIGLLLAFLAALIHNRRWINNLGRWARVSHKFSDEDVWEYLHYNPDIQWIFVRDHKLDLVYYGAVRLYSDTEKDRELLLTDVTVYSSDSELLYSTPSLYFSRHKTDLTIEEPQPESSNDTSTDQSGVTDE